MFTLYAIINDSGHTVWQTIGEFDTYQDAHTIGAQHYAAYGVPVTIEGGNK